MGIKVITLSRPGTVVDAQPHPLAILLALLSFVPVESVERLLAKVPRPAFLT